MLFKFTVNCWQRPVALAFTINPFSLYNAFIIGGFIGGYEEVKQASKDIVAPELRSIQGEIKKLDEKLDSNYQRLDEMLEARFAYLTK